MAAALMLCDPTRAFEDALILAGTLAPPFWGEGCRTSPQQKSRTSQGQIKPASKTLACAAANRAEARIRRPSAPRLSAGIAPGSNSSGVRYQGECIMARIIGFLFGLLAYAIFL